MPEPNLTPEDLPQFDSIDALDRRNEIQLGTRNKLQTRRNQAPFDLVDIDSYVIYYFDPQAGQHDFSDLFLDSKLRPVNWLAMDFDGSINFYDSRVDTFNTRLWLRELGPWDVSVEHRYRYDASDLLAGTLNCRLTPQWAVNAYARYEIQNSRLEEQSYRVERTLDCLVWRLGVMNVPAYTRPDGTERKDEFRVMAEFMVTAFPKFRMGFGDRN